MILPLSMEKTADDPCPLYHYLVVESRDPVRFRTIAPRAERRRHLRKYAEGELGEDKSFYFRGRERKLNLRAQNLQLFLQLADGVDDETWSYHLREGHYSRWFREAIKDEALAAEVERIERAPELSPKESRARLRERVEERYTGPVRAQADQQSS